MDLVAVLLLVLPTSTPSRRGGSEWYSKSRSVSFLPPTANGRSPLLLPPPPASCPFFPLGSYHLREEEGGEGEAALRTESWWGGLRSKAQLKRSKLGGGRMGQVGGRKGHLPSFHFFLCYSPAAATTTSCAPSLPSPANHHHQGWGGRKLLKSDVPWPKRERGGRNGPWTDAQPGRRRRAVVGRREGGTGGKKRARKRNNRRAKATKPSYLSSLSSTPTAPLSFPRFRVLHPPGQSVKRGNGEKRKRLPFPLSSVFLPLAIVLSRRRGQEGT